LNFDNIFKEVKIRHIVLMYMISLLICTVFTFAIIKKFNGEVNDSIINIVILFNQFLIAIMLFHKLNICKDNIVLLIEDCKRNINIKEISYVLITNILLSIGGSNIIMALIYLISPSFAGEFISESPIIINGDVDYIICFFLVVVLAPVTEELIFRHVLFKRLTEKFNIYVGLFVSVIIFSSLNAGCGMLGALGFGIINCFLYIKYKNILIPMLIHFVNNLLAITIFLPISDYSGNITIIEKNQVMFSAISGIIIFVMGVILLIRFINANKKYLRINYI